MFTIKYNCIIATLLTFDLFESVLFPSSREQSWKKATELLLDVASQGEATGYEVPCLIVAAKDDLDPYLTEIQVSTRVHIQSTHIISWICFLKPDNT